MPEENNQNLGPSINYMFCHVMLPQFFFRYLKPFIDYLSNKKDSLDEEFAFILSTLKQRGYEVEDFAKEIRYSTKIDKEAAVVGIVVKVNEPKHETECNYVCMVFTNEECRYFTSELFEASVFGDKEHFELCGWKERQHSVYHTDLEDIRSVDDMWKAVLSIVSK